MSKTAIIIGASSGIGAALALQLAKKGYALGITARRKELLESLKKEIELFSQARVLVSCFDVTSIENATTQITQLWQQLENVDEVYICAGVGFVNPTLAYEQEQQTIATNVQGFTHLALFAFRQFEAQGRGHLVGISSIACLRGNPSAPAYNASKAFVSNYLEGLALKARKRHKLIKITDVRPGFVDTAMAKSESLFWVASPAEAARQILRGVHRGKEVVYVTKRWGIIAGIMRFMPRAILAKIS